jgi:SAM-dependent methyltransferase
MLISCPHCGARLQNDVPDAPILECGACKQPFWMPAVNVTYSSAENVPNFRPELFEVPSVERAMAVIVTPEAGTTTAERWEKETPFLVEDIGRYLPVGPDCRVLDYGCGIGRIAKPLIERFGCRVVGLDTSQSMRAMALDYVRSDRFVVCTPEELDAKVGAGFRVDCCICLWVLQHILDATDALARIARALRPDGLLYAMNQIERAVPTDQGWRNDGLDVFEALRQVFSEENIHPLPAEATTTRLSTTTKIQILRKQAAGQ